MNVRKLSQLASDQLGDAPLSWRASIVWIVFLNLAVWGAIYLAAHSLYPQ